MRVFIPPGTITPLYGTKQQAHENIKQFLIDIAIDGAKAKYKQEVDWNYLFAIKYEKKKVLVEMPGIPLERVRWWDNSQSIRYFPKLYVNGSSWVWRFAVSDARGILLGTEDD